MPARLSHVAATALVAALGVTLAVRTARPARAVTMYDLDFALAPHHLPIDALAARVRRHFAELSPVPSDDAIERVGQVLVLRFARVAPMPVVVREITTSGWTFATMRGHPAHPADIRFSFETGPSGPLLRVTASGMRRASSEGSPAELVLVSAARAVWGELAANVTACR